MPSLGWIAGAAATPFSREPKDGRMVLATWPALAADVMERAASSLNIGRRECAL
jgi:hypothetical protein